MSGDVQPRKRKDKRRKKGQLEARRSEEYLEERAANILRRGSRSEDFSSPVQHPEISAPKMVKSADEGFEDVGAVNPDEVIHVQKDALLGGNICAKVVFFCLLGAIVAMVGLIIVEYRGSKVETQTEVDSPWSQMLEGWIDSTTSSVHHDDHAEGGTEEASGEEHSGEEDLLDHGHDEDEGGEHDDHENDEEHEHDDDEEGEEEEEDEDDASKEDHKTLDDEGENDNASEDEEEEENEEEDEEDDGEDDEQNKSEESLDDHDLYQDDEADGGNESEEVDEAETGHSDEDLNDEDDEGENDDLQGGDELPGITESGEDNKDEDQEPDSDQSTYLKDDGSEEAEDGEDKTFDDIVHDDDDDDDNEGEERYAEKISEDTEEQEKDQYELTADDAVEEEETSGVALKFGVGVALVVVAHVVLVRKWNSAGEDSVAAAPSSEPVASSEPEIVPETLTRRQTLVAPPAVEELPPVKPPPADPEYEEEEEEMEEEEEEEEESEKIKQTLEELKETYSHLTPEGSDLEEEEEYDYTPKLTKNVTYTPTPPESDQEQSEPEAEEDEEEEEEEEEDPMRQWQSRQAAHLLAEEVEDVQTGTEEEESDDEPPPPPPVRRKGPQEADQPDQHDPEPESKQSYVNAEITNQYDWDFYEDLDVADRELNEGHAERALAMYSSLLARAPYSPRGHHGKAKALDNLAEKQRSNELLVKAIQAYNDALNMPDIPDKLFVQIANRTIDRMRFKGMHLDAVKIHNKLIAHFHNDPLYRSQLAVTYLMINRLNDAKMVLEMSHQRWPKDGLTNCLYGLLLKLQGHYTSSVPHLMLGIHSNENGTQESNFFFHLGDALVRIGQPEEAMKVYEDGTAKGLFRSKYQRSLYNVDRLTARPWWSIEETTYQDFFLKLEKNWKIIRDEGIEALAAKKGFLNESESLRNTGDWKQFEIFSRGRKSINCQQTPVTCHLVESFSPASGCRRGQSKFSVMEGGTHVWAHCGPTNSRLRAHLGLVIPPKTFIRVADEIRSWQEGKVIIFDDSFEHEVWHNGTEQRLVLIVDVWHPELTHAERHSLSAI